MYNSVNIYCVFYIIAMRCTHPKEYKYFARSSVKSDFGLSFSKVSLPNRKDGLDSVFCVPYLQGVYFISFQDFP